MLFESEELTQLVTGDDCWTATGADHARACGLNDAMAAAMAPEGKLPYSRAGAARRHRARVIALRQWLESNWPKAQSFTAQKVLSRALNAWASSRPGDISTQWECLPYVVHRALESVCRALSCTRGGEANYGPLASALVEAMASFGIDLNSSESQLDRAVQEDFYEGVALILRDRNLAGWSYETGEPLPPLVAPVIDGFDSLKDST
jgi:hypothetical protein